MSTRGEVRDWQPGDGMTCRFASRAPRGIPCGPPVKTLVGILRVLRGKETTTIYALCENHLAETPPNKLKTAAEKAARERVLVAHWAEYQKALAEEIEMRTA